jgi:hypothetical protein
MSSTTKLDKLRNDLFLENAAFAGKLRAAADKEPLREQAWQRLLDLFRYAGEGGRRRFLDAMKLPGAAAERRRAYDVCMRSGAKNHDACQAEAEALPLFQDLFGAYPTSHTPQAWWAAPISQLIADYDPDNPPADDLRGWEHQLRQTHGKTQAELLLGVGAAFEAAEEALGDTYGSVVESATDALNAPPRPKPFPWFKLGLGLSGATLVGALAYRITRKPSP